MSVFWAGQTKKTDQNLIFGANGICVTSSECIKVLKMSEQKEYDSSGYLFNKTFLVRN